MDRFNFAVTFDLSVKQTNNINYSLLRYIMYIQHLVSETLGAIDFYLIYAVV